MGWMRLDGKIGDLIKGLGSDKRERQGRWRFSRSVTWPALNVGAEYDPSTGNLFLIEAFGSNQSFLASEFSTAGGVRLGARRDIVSEILGPPERTVSGGGSTSLYYDRAGIRFTVADMGPYAGEVGDIRINWPSVPRGDSLIIPSLRISVLEVGMPLDQALKFMGGGYHRSEPTPGSSVYYWPHFALSIVELDGYLHSVRFARDNPSDAATIRYATQNELSLSGSVAAVKSVLGEPPRKTNLSGGYQTWTYPAEGISFTFDFVQNILDVFLASDLAKLDHFLSTHPASALGYHQRGSAYLIRGDKNHAIADLNKAVELDPRYSAAYSTRGTFHLENGELEEALNDLNKAIALSPRSFAAYNNRSMIYLKAGKLQRALSDAEKSLALNPDNAFVLDTRGHVFEALGRKEEAIADYRKAISKQPDLQESKDGLRRLGITSF